MDQFTEDDFEGDELGRFRESNKLRKRNAEVMTKISQYAPEPDVSNARIDFLIQFLTRIGVMTKEQLLDFMIDSEKHMNSQLEALLVDIEHQVKAAQRQQQIQQQELIRRQREAQARQLATPVKGIVLPNGGIHQVPDKE